MIIVGDHGESLRQHGEPTHASYVYDTTMRVPLWIASPGFGFTPGQSVASAVRTIDIAPTVLDLLDLPAGDEMQGRSLRPLLLDPARPWSEPALLETHFNWFQFGWAPLRALRTDSWKLVEAPKPELYDVGSDPDELINVIEHYEILLELGGGERRVLLELAKLYALEDRFEDSQATFQQALDRDPYAPTVLYDIAIFYRHVGDTGFARRMFESVLKVAPNHSGANYQLAELLLAGDEVEREVARTLLENVVTIAPASTWAEKARTILDDWDV